MSEEPKSEEPQNKEPQSAQPQKEPSKKEFQTCRSWKMGAKVRWNKQNAQLQALDKDLRPVQETEQPNKVTREPQETAQSAAPQFEVNVYKNYISVCCVDWNSGDWNLYVTWSFCG